MKVSYKSMNICEVSLKAMAAAGIDESEGVAGGNLMCGNRHQ